MMSWKNGVFIGSLIVIFSSIAVKAEWGQWEGWSDCSLTCNHGIKTRVRICDTSNDCDGLETETENCLIQLCIAEELWSNWSSWSTCTATCGSSQKTRTRTCNNHLCNENMQTNTVDCDECVLAQCPAPPGPSDCNFETTCNEWISYDDNFIIGKTTPIPGTGPKLDNTFPTGCGNFLYFNTSFQQIYLHASDQDLSPLITEPTSVCLSFHVSMHTPQVSRMGSLCVYIYHGSGLDVYWKHEGVLTTTESMYWVPVNVDVSWPVGASHYHLGFEALGGEDGQSIIALDDIKVTDGLCTGQVDGHWTAWSNYSPCTTSCGVGERQSMRTCTSPSPNKFGLHCVGDSMKTTSCVNHPICPVNGRWRTWTTWTGCVESCGEEYQTRTRYCDDPLPVEDGNWCTLSEPIAEGAITKGLQETVKKLCPFIEDCPVPGGWSNWDFVNGEVCSATCGVGTYTKERFCSDPEPIGSGECVLVESGTSLHDTKTGGCNVKICPVDGNWGDWLEWSNAGPSVCAYTDVYRKRLCNDPEPAWGGNRCTGGSGELLDVGTETRLQVLETSGDVTSTCPVVDAAERIDCIISVGFTEEQCLAIKCCYDGAGAGQCYHPRETGALRMTLYKYQCPVLEAVAELLALTVYPNTPSQCLRADAFEYTDDDEIVGERFYGVLMWAYFIAPADGMYKFSARCYQYCTLSITVDGTNTLVIPTNTPRQTNTNFEPPSSTTVTLATGVKYYLEGHGVAKWGTLHHFQFGVVFPIADGNPGGAEEEPISAKYLSANAMVPL